MVGKKQRDIREGNKSAVIDCLLNRHMTLPNLGEKLNLSHTSLRKVMSELMNMNIVRIIDMKTGEMGRPSAVYDINPDCGFSAAICFGECRLEIFVLDMKGFEVNKFVIAQDFSSAKELFDFSIAKLKQMNEKGRSCEVGISTVCVSIPFGGIYGKNFEYCAEYVKVLLDKTFSGTEVIVKNNNDFWAIAESKYGRLDGVTDKGAFLVEVEGGVCCSFYYNGVNYCGQTMQRGTINNLFDGDLANYVSDRIGCKKTEMIERYVSDDPTAVAVVDEICQTIFTIVGKASLLLNVPLVLIDGVFASCGRSFLRKANEYLQKISRNTVAEYSLIADRSPSCAGAVRHASYISLKKKL